MKELFIQNECPLKLKAVDDQDCNMIEGPEDEELAMSSNPN